MGPILYSKNYQINWLYWFKILIKHTQENSLHQLLAYLAAMVLLIGVFDDFSMPNLSLCHDMGDNLHLVSSYL